MSNNANNTPSTQCIEIQGTQLPLSCPTPDMALWNQHPKVSLSFDAEGKARCPYCGAHYQLRD